MLILVVENNPLYQELMQQLLGDAGHDVALATDGAQLRSLAEETTPDLVLIDLILGAESGFDLLRELRSRPAFFDVPILAVTGQALAADRELLLCAGFDDVLSKPVDPQTFVTEVELHTRRARANAS